MTDTTIKQEAKSLMYSLSKEKCYEVLNNEAEYLVKFGEYPNYLKRLEEIKNIIEYINKKDR